MSPQAGRAVPLGTAPETVRRALTGSLGDGNMQDRGLSFGKAVDGGLAGKHDAVYAVVQANGSATFDVPHQLGRRPEFMILVHTENTQTPGTIVVYSAETPELWTETTARARLDLRSGSLNGLVCKFLIA